MKRSVGRVRQSLLPRTTSALRHVVAATSLLGLLSLPAACNKMSEEDCSVLRTEAYEIVNKAHTCITDADCEGTSWPGCAKPVNTKSLGEISEIEKKFKKGECVEPKGDCREVPEIYCKQGLCVTRERASKSP